MSVHAFFAELSGKIGLPVDQLKYVTMMVLFMFLGPVYRPLPPLAKHAFSIVASIGAMIFCLGPTDWVHSVISSAIVYLILRFGPAKKAHVFTFAFAFAYMTISHIYRMYTDYLGWSLDFTGPQMVLTLKLISLAFCYSDGRRDPATLTDSQKEKAVKTLPSLLEYFGFVFFYPSFLAGPYVEYSDYKKYVDGTQFQDKLCNGKPPSTLVPTLLKLAETALYMGGTLIGDIYFPLKYLATDAYFQKPLWYRLGLVMISTPCIRFRYYFGWKLAECSFISCGSAYRTEKLPDGSLQARWDKYNNAQVLGVELAPNIRSMIASWNCKTADWLREYVYVRVPSVDEVLTGKKAPPPDPNAKKEPRKPAGPKRKALAVLLDPTLLTFVVSAFWHGFYPGYYHFFVMASLCTSIARDVRSMVRPMFVAPGRFTALKPLYDFMTFISTVFVMDYGGVSFVFLTWKMFYSFYHNLYYLGHVGILVLFVVTKVASVLRPRPPRDSTKKPVQQPLPSSALPPQVKSE